MLKGLCQDFAAITLYIFKTFLIFDSFDIKKVLKSYLITIRLPLYKMFLSGGGEGGGHSIKFYRGMSKPLPFYTPFLIEKVPLLSTFHRKLYPLHIPK